jgi:hypothetical protein
MKDWFNMGLDRAKDVIAIRMGIFIMGTGSKTIKKDTGNYTVLMKTKFIREASRITCSMA